MPVSIKDFKYFLDWLYECTFIFEINGEEINLKPSNIKADFIFSEKINKHNDALRIICTIPANEYIELISLKEIISNRIYKNDAKSSTSYISTKKYQFIDGKGAYIPRMFQYKIKENKYFYYIYIFIDEYNIHPKWIEK